MADEVYSLPELILPTREQINAVLNEMHRRIKQDRDISVGELNELIGLTGRYTDEQHGWSRLEVVRIVPVEDGFRLELPSVRKLNR